MKKDIKFALILSSDKGEVEILDTGLRSLMVEKDNGKIKFSNKNIIRTQNEIRFPKTLKIKPSIILENLFQIKLKWYQKYG